MESHREKEKHLISDIGGNVVLELFTVESLKVIKRKICILKYQSQWVNMK